MEAFYEWRLWRKNFPENFLLFLKFNEGYARFENIFEEIKNWKLNDEQDFQIKWSLKKFEHL